MKTFVLIGSMIALIAPLAAPQTNNRGSIEGIVIRAGTSEPVPNVQISGTGTQGDAQSMMPLTVVTESNGHFQIPDMLPGQYRLQLQRDGYFAPNSPIPGMTTTVTVAPQQKIKDLAYSLVQGGTISGRVLDPDGKGLAKISLSLLQLTYNPQNGLPVLRASAVQTFAAVAQNQANRAAGGGIGANLADRRGAGTTGFMTDDEGRYRMFWFPPGTYYLRTELSQGTSAQTQRLIGKDPGPAYATTYYPNTADVGVAVPIVVRSGAESSGMDIHVQPPGVTISGKIISGITERSGAELHLLPRDQTKPGESSQSQILQFVDLSIGAFEIRGVAPGSYLLYARTYAPGARGQVTIPGSASAAVEVRKVDIDGIALEWRPNVEIRGRVVLDGNPSPTTLGGRGQLFKVAAVTQVQPVIINSDGTFTATSVELGRYLLSIPARGLPAGSYIADIRQGSRSVMNDGIIVIDTPDPPAIEVAVKTSGGSVRGIAQNTKSMPSRGVLVLVPQAPRRANVQLYRRVSADPSGQFAIGDIVPGEYKLFGWEEPTDIDVSALLNADFISKYEVRGVSVSVREGTISGNLVLNLIPAQ